MAGQESKKTLGRYEIQEELGKGAFATVYRARDTVLNREVALKVLHPQLLVDPDWVARFSREAQVMANLRHPHIVAIYDVVEGEGRLYIVMELARGPHLGRRIAERGRLSWAEMLAVLGPVAAALDHAHGQGVVHRDLKPANILLDSERGPLVSDFGFARLVGESSLSGSYSGGVVGTPAYIAPEVWRGEKAGPAADIYALGCIVWEMLRGAALFQGDSPAVVMQKHLLEGPQFPQVRPAGSPPWLEEVLRQALAQEPGQRWSSAGELARALEAALGGLSGGGRKEGGEAAYRAALRQAWLADRLEQAEAALRPLRQRLRPAEARRVEEEVRGEVAQALLEQGRREEAAGQAEEAAVTYRRVLQAAPEGPAAAQVQEARRRWLDMAQEWQEAGGTAEARWWAGLAEAVAGTTIPNRQPFEPELVRIPAGEFLMGSDKKKDPKAFDDELPQHRLYLPEYHIARTPVTNAQYAAFVRAAGYQAPEHWQGGRPPAGEEEHPVVYVSWEDALAYCHWLAEATGRPYTLPSEAEWEKAARGPDGRVYPWGDEWDARRCNSSEGGKGGTTPVGAYPAGASPYGLLDMAGNVWEWTRSLYQPYPYDPGDGREDLGPSGPRVLRGGSWVSDEWNSRAAYRNGIIPDFHDVYICFRCVVLPGH